MIQMICFINRPVWIIRRLAGIVIVPVDVLYLNILDDIYVVGKQMKIFRPKLTFAFFGFMVKKDCFFIQYVLQKEFDLSSFLYYYLILIPYFFENTLYIQAESSR
jgi:hypothetical protein